MQRAAPEAKSDLVQNDNSAWTAWTERSLGRGAMERNWRIRPGSCCQSHTSNSALIDTLTLIHSLLLTATVVCQCFFPPIPQRSLCPELQSQERALLSMFVKFCSCCFFCLGYPFFCIYRNSTHSSKPTLHVASSLKQSLTHSGKGIQSLLWQSLAAYPITFEWVIYIHIIY